jgi:hypothetical protein
MTLDELKKRIADGTAKNILIAYEGGGYDGCIWEPNFAYINGEGEFASIYASGYMGKETLPALMDALESKRERDYDIYSEDEMDKFPEVYNESLVHAVGEWLEEHEGISITAKCKRCGGEFPVATMTPADYAGMGGIVSLATGLYCEDCIRLHNRVWTIEVSDEDGDRRDEEFYNDELPEYPALDAALESLPRDHEEGEWVTFKDGIPVETRWGEVTLLRAKYDEEAA